ncbi:hypothetical protein [Sporosarcina sp. Te-1]|uniref:hypothetical protein n=1 Tax=Sporosarcina sp. Te-1 TaxID=2818390 RepID=UPI001A9E65E4|nr:hypothetical protein [Sporosarcina sp. Te-1]QTD43123.1 hypothetical protein J3U78_10455 [Sporosarcina sp. Te-1]
MNNFLLELLSTEWILPLVVAWILILSWQVIEHKSLTFMAHLHMAIDLTTEKEDAVLDSIPPLTDHLQLRKTVCRLERPEDAEGHHLSM